jgi:hypothetical protein
MTIYACIKPCGHVRMVAGAGQCREDEQEVHWEEVGPSGPQGSRGPQGEQGLPGPRGQAVEVPSGAVMFFDQAQCPDGWTELTAAQGRALLGLPKEGQYGLTRGAALEEDENRSHKHGLPVASTSEEGLHWHWVDVPGPWRTQASGAHEHGVTETSQILQVYSAGINPVQLAASSHTHGTSTRGGHQHDMPHPTTHLNFMSGDDGMHSHEVPPSGSATDPASASDVIPFMHLLVCRKD